MCDKIDKEEKISEIKDKRDNYEKEEIFKKKYRVPDANNKKGFDKINYYNFIGITKFITFAELSEISYVNKKFYMIISQRYMKKNPMVKASLSIMKKNIYLKLSEDFKYYLAKNGFHIREIIRKIIESLVTEYFPKLGIKRFFFGKINYHTHISEISLDNCDIGKKSMKYLSFYLNNPNCEIKNINISNNKIAGDILLPIQKNKNLEFSSIIADKCMIDSKALNILSSLKTKKLSLVSDNIDNEHISKLSSDYINELNISHNLISNDGVFHICKNFSNLTKLNLSNNNLCDLSLIYLCLYIKNQNCKLISLNLKNNIITITGMLTLISTLNFINKENKKIYVLKRLNLSGNLLDYSPIPNRLGTDFLNVNLEKLSLSHHSFSTNDLNIIFDFINNIKNIKILDLSNTIFENVSLNLIFKRIAENKTLKKLKLQTCYLGNTEINNNNLLNPNLKNNINNKDNTNNKEINEKKEEDKNNLLNNNIFSENLGIESLDLGYNFVNYKKLNNLILSNHIKELNIEGNDLFLWGDEIYLFFDFVITNKFLEKLNLSKNYLQKMANKLLEKMYNYNNENNSTCLLKYLSLEDNQIDNINLELTNFLSNNKNLETLNLKQNSIDDKLANNYFFHSLFKNKDSNIKEINISDNKISLEFLNKIIKYSKENILEKNNFILNVSSKEIKEEYIKIDNKKQYWELFELTCIKCL